MIMMDKEHISVDNAVKAQKVNLSNLLQKVKEEEKKKKKQHGGFCSSCIGCYYFWNNFNFIKLPIKSFKNCRGKITKYTNCTSHTFNCRC